MVKLPLVSRPRTWPYDAQSLQIHVLDGGAALLLQLRHLLVRVPRLDAKLHVNASEDVAKHEVPAKIIMTVRV